MSPKEKTVFVRSSECTHVLSDEGLVLEGGAVTEIPEKHLTRALTFPGVTQFNPDKTTE